MMEYLIFDIEKPTDKILKQRVTIKEDLIKWLNTLSIPTKVDKSKIENIELVENTFFSDDKERKI